MCGISKSSLVLLGVGAIAAGLALTPALTSNAWAGEKAGTKPGVPQPKKLEVGSAAPDFFVSKWLKGEPVKSFQPGKVYVVEFWATWCPPCRESIPHLTELQKQFKESVTVIGMASAERVNPDGKDERFVKASKFVKDQGDKMNYRVGFESDRRVNKAWMEAAGVNTIPHAFVVDGEGKIAFIGDPREPAMEEAIKKAVEAAAAKPSGQNSKDSDKH